MRRTLFSCLRPCLCVAWCPGGVCVVRGVLSRAPCQPVRPRCPSDFFKAGRFQYFQQSLVALQLGGVGGRCRGGGGGGTLRRGGASGVMLLAGVESKVEVHQIQFINEKCPSL